MKALFVHTHIFHKIGNDVYSPGGLPKAAWNRYLSSVDELVVVSRGKEVKEISSSLTLSSRDHVKFDLLYEVKGGFDYYKYKSTIIRKLESQIKQVDFVIIRAPSTIGYFAYQLCKKLNKPFVVEVVACAWDGSWNYGTLPVKIQAPLAYLKLKKIVRESYATTYVTQYFLQKRYPSNAKIQIHASNVQIPTFSENILKNHQEFLTRDIEVLNLGMIGNLNVKYKGYDVAVKSLKLLKENYPNLKFKLYFVGGGDQAYLKNLIKISGLEEYTEIVGRLQSGNEVFNFLDTLDLYIHPSKQEGLPRSVIEAMSRACPVLASSVAGIPELVESKYLHKPGDYNKFYNDLVDVLTNKKLRLEMAKTNFLNSKDYRLEILEKRRIQFFQNIVNSIKK